MSYEKNRRCRLQTLEKEILNDPSGESDNGVTVAGKGHRIRTNIHAARKRAVTNVDVMEVAHVKAYKRQRQLEQVSASLDQEDTSGGFSIYSIESSQQFRIAHLVFQMCGAIVEIFNSTDNLDHWIILGIVSSS